MDNTQNNQTQLQPRNIFEKILLGVQIACETTAGLATDMEGIIASQAKIQEQLTMIMGVLFPPDDSEPTALGTETNEK